MKTVLVTGASGFVGRHMVEALAHQGIRSRWLVRQTRRWDSCANGSAEFVLGDVTAPASLNAAVEGVDGIIHCAGLTRALAPADYQAVNVDGCRNLYEACLARNPGVGRIIHIGSLAAWGPSVAGAAVQEGQPPRPVSHYGLSKLAGQRIAEGYMDRLPIVLLAPPAVYGPYDRAFLGLFAGVKRGFCVRIGREERRISLLYAKDLARAALAGLENEKAAGNTYLLEDGRPHTWREITAAIGQSMHTSPVRIPIPRALVKAVVVAAEWRARRTGIPTLMDRDRLRDFLQPAWVCSAAAIGADLGFVTQYPLEVGVAETCRWYQEHHWL